MWHEFLRSPQGVTDTSFRRQSLRMVPEGSPMEQPVNFKEDTVERLAIAYSAFRLEVRKSAAGPILLYRHHRPGTILYQNDRYDVLRFP